MIIGHIMSTSKILIDLYAIRGNIKIKPFLQILLAMFQLCKCLGKKHKKVCLKINGKQSVKLRSCLIKFKNHFKQLAAPFKIDADFESVLKGVQSCNSNNNNSSSSNNNNNNNNNNDSNNNNNNNASYIKMYREHIRCSFAYKVVCIDDRFSKQVVLYC